jgi:beta-lactamase class A
MFARAAYSCALVLGLIFSGAAAASAAIPPPLARLNADLRSVARRVPAAIGLDVVDLESGFNAGFNAGKSMPAASTIKLPVMVAVFEALSTGTFDLNRHITLEAQDKDYGSGDLCYAPIDSTYSVSDLLDRMIDVSDNTATNMLIRVIGRRNINGEMTDLGLVRTRLLSDVRTEAWSVRSALRTSPADLAHLLTLMAKGELIDRWSSNEMIAILEADRINTLLPQPLPPDIAIAHKTGSFFDTLNDAGIVYAGNSPYVIAVMTTALPSQDLGRAFIRKISRLTYTDEVRTGRWRAAHGVLEDKSPDVNYWVETTP